MFGMMIDSHSKHHVVFKCHSQCVEISISADHSK